MKDKNVNEVSHQFLLFIFKIHQWLHDNYFKEFNINGKGNRLLTDRQFMILVLIHQFKSCTISDLVKELNVSSSSLSIVVSKLVKEGYVERRYPSEGEDRRKTYLFITEKGRNVLTDVYEGIMTVFGEFFYKLDESQQEDFADGLKKLSNIFDN